MSLKREKGDAPSPIMYIQWPYLRRLETCFVMIYFQKLKYWRERREAKKLGHLIIDRCLQIRWSAPVYEIARVTWFRSWGLFFYFKAASYSNVSTRCTQNFPFWNVWFILFLLHFTVVPQLLCSSFQKKEGKVWKAEASQVLFEVEVIHLYLKLCGVS